MTPQNPPHIIQAMRAPVEQLRIREAAAEDLSGLAEVWMELMSFHESTDPRFALASDAILRWRALAHEMMYRDDGFVILAELDHRPAGFCLGWVAKNPPIYRQREVGFISEIAVARSAQRRGIGTELVGAARAWFLERGLDEFQLSTAVWNESAQKFWAALGGEPLLMRYRFDTELGPGGRR